MYILYVCTYEQGLVKFNTLHTLELVKHVYTNLHTYIRTYLYIHTQVWTEYGEEVGCTAMLIKGWTKVITHYTINTSHRTRRVHTRKPSPQGSFRE